MSNSTTQKTVAEREAELAKILDERFYDFTLLKVAGEDDAYYIRTSLHLRPHLRSHSPKAVDVFSMSTTDCFTLEKAEQWVADMLAKGYTRA